jgi:hypothetical protein
VAAEALNVAVPVRASGEIDAAVTRWGREEDNELIVPFVSLNAAKELGLIIPHRS